MNLRFLCPNCHSQTENFGAKNRKFWPPKEKYCKEQHDLETKNEKNVREVVLSERKKKIDDFIKQINQIFESKEVNFLQHGWVTKVANLIKQKPAVVSRKIRKFMPQFYIENCLRR